MLFKRIKTDMAKYGNYALHSAKAQLKSEVANSYLNWLWWILDPLCFMMIYYFMFGYVFNSKEPFFLLFIFIGITMWDFFNKTVKQSIKIVKTNKSVVSKVYLPKYILLLIKMGVNAFKMGVSIILIVIMMIVCQVPITWNILFFIPILITLALLVFGISCFLLHFGVFVEDLSNVVAIILRLLFYLTGVFWNINRRLPAPLNSYAYKYNPIAFLLSSMRDCVIYETTPNLTLLGIWALISLVLSILGIYVIYKNENSYVKVI